MPRFAVGRLGATMRQARLSDFSPEQLVFLTYGRGVDTTRMRTQLGFEPAYSTAEACADFCRDLTDAPLEGAGRG
jgi:UDP-glucose 4-epimerase